MSELLVPEEIIAQRKELRKKILFSFYEFNFKTGGLTKKFTPNISPDAEEAAVHHYLIETGLLYAEQHSGGMLTVKISPSGINFIESGSEF